MLLYPSFGISIFLSECFCLERLIRNCPLLYLVRNQFGILFRKWPWAFKHRRHFDLMTVLSTWRHLEWSICRFLELRTPVKGHINVSNSTMILISQLNKMFQKLWTALKRADSTSALSKYISYVHLCSFPNLLPNFIYSWTRTFWDMYIVCSLEFLNFEVLEFELS